MSQVSGLKVSQGCKQDDDQAVFSPEGSTGEGPTFELPQVWQNSSSCGGMTKIPVFLLAMARGCSQLRRPPVVPCHMAVSIGSLT